ncbi:MAG: phosphotransferase [Eubacteriaceae bacterium]|nr:phosphotransferase [Eubacteriaceae bacterium]
MLKLKYLFENYPLAKEALKNWPHDEEDLDKLLSRFRISSNAIYPFKSSGKLAFLRLAPISEKLEKNIRGELEFIDYLCENDFPALVPMKSLGGETLLVLDTAWGEYYASAFWSVEGVQIENTDFSDGIMREYGASLGRLHSLSSAYEPRIRKWSHEDALEWIKGVLLRYQAPPCALRELESLKSALSSLERTPRNYGLVHYDYEPDNVFYLPEKNKCSAIDFDDGMYHWYALDCCQVFESLEDCLPEDGAKRAKEKFIEGYREHYSYGSNEESLLKPMSRFINLFGYARIIRSVHEAFENEPEWLTELRKKLERFISEKEGRFGE